METIRIQTQTPYDVHIGKNILSRAGELAARLGKHGTAALVMDENVAALYGDTVSRSFAAAGFRVLPYRFPAGEASKCFDRLAHLLEFLAENELSRSDCVVALGGGVTGDLAGFAAAVYRRGTPFVQLPTTLLAAVDSSVGGKTAVNLPSGKNLAGAFWQPDLVLCDCAAFATLPRGELASGAAECAKYAVLGNAPLLRLLAEKGLDTPWESIVADCVRQKAGLVVRDERDTGERQLLNLGHTFGHAAEKLSGYALRHGEGVAIGMVIAAHAAQKLGLCSPDVAPALVETLRALCLPVSCAYAPQDVARAAFGDKKRRGDEITLVLPRALGHCVLHPVKTAELESIVRLGMEDLPCA